MKTCIGFLLQILILLLLQHSLAEPAIIPLSVLQMQPRLSGQYSLKHILRLSSGRHLAIYVSFPSNSFAFLTLSESGVQINETFLNIESPLEFRSAIATEDGGVLMLAERRMLPQQIYSNLIAIRLDADLGKVWERGCTNATSFLFITWGRISYNSTTRTYAVAVPATPLDNWPAIEILEFEDPKGDIIRRKKLAVPFGLTMLSIVSHSAERMVYAFSANGSSRIATVTPTTEPVTDAEFQSVEFLSVLPTQAGTVVMFRKSYYYPASEIVVMKFAPQPLSLVWSKTFIVGGETGKIGCIETAEGHYIFFGSVSRATAKVDSDSGYVERLTELYPNGTIGWVKVFSKFSGGLESMLEMRKGHYLLWGMGDNHQGGEPQRIVKMILPDPVEDLRCYDMDNCKNCPMEFYWNYTQCLTCSKGCVDCVHESKCRRCHSPRYIKSSNNLCVKNATWIQEAKSRCNCSAAAVLPECRANCTVPVCQFSQQEGTVPLSRGCTCPSTALNNGSHCIRERREGCPDLCSRCVTVERNETYCTACRSNVLRVVTHRTQRYFVDCRCEFGHWFNGTECAPAAVASSLEEDRHSRESGSGMTAVLAGAGVVATAVLIWMCTARCRRRDLAYEPQKTEAQKSHTSQSTLGETGLNMERDTSPIRQAI